MFTYRFFNSYNDLFDLAERVFNNREYGKVNAEYPAIQLYEGDNRYVIKASLPGLKREEVDVQINNNLLTIEGEKKSDNSDQNCLRRERSLGKFHKTVKLGEGIDREKVTADLKNGILTIELPKSQKAPMKKIEVREK